MDYTGLKQEIERELYECGVELRWAPEHSGQKYGYNLCLHGGGMETIMAGAMVGIDIFDSSLPLRTAEDIVVEMIGEVPECNAYVATVHDILLYYTPEE
jgi:hypothetical protein